MTPTGITTYNDELFIEFEDDFHISSSLSLKDALEAEVNSINSHFLCEANAKNIKLAIDSLKASTAWLESVYKKWEENNFEKI